MSHVCHTCGEPISQGMMLRVGPRTARTLGLGDETLYTHPLACRLPIEHAVARMGWQFDDEGYADYALNDRALVPWTAGLQ